MAIPPWGSPPSSNKVKKTGDVMTGDLDFTTHFLIFTDECNNRWKVNVTCSGIVQAVPYLSSLYGSAIYGSSTYV